MDKAEIRQRALENHTPVCLVPQCPEKTSARLTDGDRRKDVCRRHALVSMKYIEGLEVVATWNELTMEDFDE